MGPRVHSGGRVPFPGRVCSKLGLRRLAEILAWALLLTPSFAQGQTPTWQRTNGPYGASVWAVTVQPNDDVLAGTDGGGVFRSTDSGESWTPLGLLGIHTLTLVEKSPGLLFAGTVFDGVFRSTDNGQTWIQFDAGLVKTGAPGEPRYAVPALAVAGNGHLLAGTGDYIQGFTGKGILRSTDNGETWNPVSPELDGRTVPCLAVRADGTLFAGTMGKGVFRSTDGGGTWTQRGLDGFGVASLLLLPNGKLLAGLAGGAVKISADDGLTWSSSGISNTGMGVQYLAANQLGHVFAGTRGAGLYRSMNEGVTWERMNTGLRNLDVHAAAFNSRGEVFAGNWGWVQRSSDNGQTWVERITGLTGTRVRCFAFDAEGAIYATNDGFRSGLVRSVDRGESWTDLGFQGEFTQAVVCDPTGALYVGTAKGVYRSVDQGLHWENLNHGLDDPRVSTIAINSLGHLFLGTGHRETRSQGEGIYRSVDRGSTWTLVNNGLLDMNIWDLAVATNGALLASTNRGVFRSTDNGDTWARTDTGLPDDLRGGIAVNRANGKIFVAAHGRGVIRSLDHGASWTSINQGFSSGTFLRAVAVSARGHLVAAGKEAYYSEDEGDTWTEITTGLPTRAAEAIAVGPDAYVYLGCYAAGVFRLIDPLHVILGVSPARATLLCGGSVALSGAVNTGTILWTATGGSLSATSGVSVTFTAPAAPGTVLVSAMASADPSQVSTTTIQVRNGDLDGDGAVGVLDLAYFARNYGSSDGACDLNGDGVVDEADIAIFLGGM